MNVWKQAPWALAKAAVLAASLLGGAESANAQGLRPAFAPLGRLAERLSGWWRPRGEQQFCAVTQPTQQPPASSSALVWLNDYGKAYTKAHREGRMLLVNFTAAGHPYQQQFEQTLAERKDLRDLLAPFVLVSLPTDAQVQLQGHSQRLLSHPAFAEMHQQPGIAIVDLAHREQRYYGRTVSAFPFSQGKYYQWNIHHLPVILTLPPGTLTQRTMVWAVRTHPERPASTNGMMDPVLAAAASSHSAHQAQIGLQGHHRWESRFHRLRRLLGGGLPVEVVAESWPGQTLADSCIDCVASWRQSSGHWNAVRNWQSGYGYDIRRGSNGIWYATGIFVTRR
jgi:hypothetical protein